MRASTHSHGSPGPWHRNSRLSRLATVAAGAAFSGGPPRIFSRSVVSHEGHSLVAQAETECDCACRVGNTANSQRGHGGTGCHQAQRKQVLEIHDIRRSVATSAAATVGPTLCTGLLPRRCEHRRQSSTPKKVHHGCSFPVHLHRLLARQMQIDCLETGPTKLQHWTPGRQPGGHANSW